MIEAPSAERGQRLGRGLADAGSGAEHDGRLAGEIEEGAIVCEPCADVSADVAHGMFRSLPAAGSKIGRIGDDRQC